MAIYIGIDVGGTFTDIVVLQSDSGVIQLFKVPSTRPATAGIFDGIKLASRSLSIQPTEITRLVHGSTVATNAILEGKWAKTALLTTDGFRDVLEIGRQNRPSLYDLSVERPAPLVPRKWRFGVIERLDYQGEILKNLELAPLEKVVDILKKEEIESVAISYLFSYLNPAHEQATQAFLSQKLNIPITLSSEVLPEYREYERTATTVMSAALRPVVGRYLQELDTQIGDYGIQTKLQVMLSNAGIVSATRAARQAVQMLFSGPTGGVEGARFIGNQAGFQDLVTFDMGGTSTDVSLIKQNQIAMKTEGVIEGRPVRMPMVDIHSIGAGGGSLAWIDAGKALRVGPPSAGADPGPACYGHGALPTVTDAQLVLGRLSEKNLLGSWRLNRERAEEAIFNVIAKPLGLSLERAASGILEVADAQMERAIRLITVERGHDPRTFVLLAFGGAGPMHGGALAEQLGIPKVIAPPVAGVLSALGLLVADSVHDFVQTFIQPVMEIDYEKAKKLFEKMQREADTRLQQEDALVTVKYRRAIDLRYRGQSHELPIELESGEVSAQIMQSAVNQFHHTHQQLYGYAMPERPVELVNFRLKAIGQRSKPSLTFASATSHSAPSQANNARTRKVFFRGLGWVESQIWARDALQPGVKFQGPAVIEGRESTVVIFPNQRAAVDAYSNIIIESEGAR